MPLINSLMLPLFFHWTLALHLLHFSFSNITNHFDCSVLYRKSSDYKDRRMKSALRNDRSKLSIRSDSWCHRGSFNYI